MLSRALCAHLYAFIFTTLVSSAAAGTTPAASLASSYALSTSTTFAFPTQTLSSSASDSFISTGWSLSRGKLENGGSDLTFVSDPFPNSPAPGTSVGANSSGPVLQVLYPAGSFNNNTGGAQFYSLWNSSTPFESMLLSYEIAFDSGFDWVKGGKLPGIRGGPSVIGCDGGNEPNGTDCFSTRVMWRTDGEGEIYAYVPTSNNLCNDKGIICNDDFGTSIDRGAFTFPSGQWSRVTLLVQMNNPPDVANGFTALYFNDVQAIAQGGLQIRSASAVTAGGFFFSTFFGGSDSSWATPVDTHTYFRNIELWGGFSPSNMSGSAVNAASPATRAREWGWVVFVAVIMFFCGIELV